MNSSAQPKSLICSKQSNTSVYFRLINYTQFTDLLAIKMANKTPEWKNTAGSVFTKINITPSRNPNYVKGRVNEGDRYVSLRNEEQMELASHLLSTRLVRTLIKFNTFTSQ
jgi:hypothetical protein